MKIDQKDSKIIEILKSNAKLTTGQISKKLLIPITTVHNRIKKLEKAGVIEGYTIKLNYKKLGFEILAFIQVNVIYTLPSGKKIKQEEVAKKIKKLDGVEEVWIVAGGTDLLVKVRVKSIDKLNDLVINKLRMVEGVDKTQTLVVLKEV